MKNKLLYSFGATSIVANSKSREAVDESRKKTYEFNQGRPPIDRLGRKRVKRNLLGDFSSCVAGKRSVLNFEKTNKDGSIVKNSNQSMNLKAIKTARNSNLPLRSNDLDLYEGNYFNSNKNYEKEDCSFSKSCSKFFPTNKMSSDRRILGATKNSTAPSPILNDARSFDCRDRDQDDILWSDKNVESDSMPRLANAFQRKNMPLVPSAKNNRNSILSNFSVQDLSFFSQSSFYKSRKENHLYNFNPNKSGPNSIAEKNDERSRNLDYDYEYNTMWNNLG